MWVLVENEVTLLSYLVNVHTTDTTDPLRGSEARLDPKREENFGKPISVTPPPHRHTHMFFHTHVPACLHGRSPHGRGALTSEATALSSMLEHPLSRSVLNPPRVTFPRPLPPAGHTDGTVRKHLASVVTWHLDHGPPHRIPSTIGSAVVDHVYVCLFPPSQPSRSSRVGRFWMSGSFQD